MSSLINKAKEFLSSDKTATDDSHGRNDMTGTNTGYTTGTNTDTTTDTTTGLNRSNLADRDLADRDLDEPRTGVTTTSSGLRDTEDTTSGSLGSNLRGDRDLDESRAGLTSTSRGVGDNTTTSGSLDSNLGSNLDARGDRDFDESRTGLSSDSSNTYRTPAVGGDVRFGAPGEKNPHHTTMTGEALDPHIGSTGMSTGLTNTGYSSTDSGDRTGSGIMGSTGYGDSSDSYDRSSNTAGPHNSDMMNKLDPRVDSNQDGSKTYGGNQTYSQ